MLQTLFKAWRACRETARLVLCGKILFLPVQSLARLQETARLVLCGKTFLFFTCPKPGALAGPCSKPGALAGFCTKLENTMPEWPTHHQVLLPVVVIIKH